MAKRLLHSHLLVLFFLFSISLSWAQAPRAVARITNRIDDGVRVTLKGNVHPLAQPRYDRGAVPDSFPAERMFLVLQRSPEREAALRQFIADAHTKGSPSYQRWLTPEQVGELYGPADSDIAAVTGWLQGHGFSVGRVTKAKTAIEFSGNAGQLRSAFGTEIHAYSVQDELHYANDRDPQIPLALAPVVAGITALNDFRPRPYAKLLGQATYDRSTQRWIPQWTFPSSHTALLFAPADFALQYNLNPLYAAGINGAGVTIGIIGDEKVDPAVIATYRSFFGLPPGQFNIVNDSEGLAWALWEMVENYLDVELAGAVAPGATINLYTSANTSLQYGLNLSAQRAVDDNVASVLSTSYGLCEQDLGPAGNQFWGALWEQAAAQGQTSFVAAGDGGPAGCDNFNAGQPAQRGPAVSGLASTPWNLAVGGTDFYYSSYNGSSVAQQTELASFWNLTPTLFPTTSLLQRVPEQPWNDPFGLNLATGGVYDPNSPRIVGGSGGPSSCATGVEATDGSGTYSACAAGYAKPAWQSGPGVPDDGVRDLPDVSLFAAGENDSGYPICIWEGECVISNGNLSVGVAGGTSASSPAMAGIMALVNQRYGRQGQANFTLYPLAVQHSSVFHDVTVGSNVVPCAAGTPNCSLSAAKDNTNGQYTFGYYAAEGYDFATGLGTVDANLLVQYWDSLIFKPTTTALTLSSTTFPHGTPVQVNVAVSSTGGTPSGDVALLSTASSTGLGAITLASGSASSVLNSLPGGQYQLTARYAGDTLFAPSTSAPVTLNVTPEDSTLGLLGKVYGSNSWQPVSGSYSYGTYIVFDANPRGANAAPGSLDGIPTGTVTFSDAADSGNATSGSVALDRTGVAEWVPVTAFAAGTHHVSATYSGDAGFRPSSSPATIDFSITKLTPETQFYTLSGFYAKVGLGVPITLELLVGSLPHTTPPSGTATFYLGDTKLGTAAVGGAPHTSMYWYYSQAVADLTVSDLPLGANSITAVYSGDSNYEAVTSLPETVTVMQPATLTLAVNPPSGNLAQNYTATATISASAGQPAPTGDIWLRLNGSRNDWEPIVNGAATFSFDGTTFWPGTIQVTAEYEGDSVYAPSYVTVPVTMTMPFSMSAGTPVDIAAGATTANTSTLTVTPAAGFAGSVFFSCKLEYYPPGVNSQKLPTCSVPLSLTLNGTDAVTAAMTISSTAPTTVALNGPGRWFGAQAGTIVFGFLIVVPMRRRLRRGLLGFLLVLALAVSSTSCGTSPAGGGGGHMVPGTTPGNYIFSVKGSFTVTSYPQIEMVNVTIR